MDLDVQGYIVCGQFDLQDKTCLPGRVVHCDGIYWMTGLEQIRDLLPSPRVRKRQIAGRIYDGARAPVPRPPKHPAILAPAQLSQLAPIFLGIVGIGHLERHP